MQSKQSLCQLCFLFLLQVHANKLAQCADFGSLQATLLELFSLEHISQGAGCVMSLTVSKKNDDAFLLQYLAVLAVTIVLEERHQTNSQLLQLPDLYAA